MDIKVDAHKRVVFCPYCASDKIKYVLGVPRCMDCRSVFFVSFSRLTRKSPRLKK
jgi:hypothetical protein